MKTVQVKVSGPMLRQPFHPCIPVYIKENCRGRCCQGSGSIMVTVHPTEAQRIEALGVRVEAGFIVPDCRGLCPLKADDGLCRAHGEAKPFGCRASPFTLNSNNTLIIRNRYRSLRCYKGQGSLPAYDSHAWSLAQILGPAEAGRVTAQCKAGQDVIMAKVSGGNYAMLKDNDAAKHSLKALV